MWSLAAPEDLATLIVDQGAPPPRDNTTHVIFRFRTLYT